MRRHYISLRQVCIITILPSGFGSVPPATVLAYVRMLLNDVIGIDRDMADGLGITSSAVGLKGSTLACGLPTKHLNSSGSGRLP